jgi:O-antigen/teichoic acid export membrane protein
MVRCKACGYIMEQGKLRDRCPACGAPRTSFEPYTDPVGPRRRRTLSFHLHPIAVHFPTTLAVAVFIFSFAAPFFGGQARVYLTDTTKILALFLPLTIILAVALGWIEGLIRFRKIGNSQILKRKILYASLFFVETAVLAVLVWVGGLQGVGYSLPTIVLGAVAIYFAILLGLLGMSISNAAFPGK